MSDFSWEEVEVNGCGTLKLQLDSIILKNNYNATTHNYECQNLILKNFSYNVEIINMYMYTVHTCISYVSY